MTALVDRIDRERDIAYREHMYTDHRIGSAKTALWSDPMLPDFAQRNPHCETCETYALSTTEGA